MTPDLDAIALQLEEIIHGMKRAGFVRWAADVEGAAKELLAAARERDALKSLAADYIASECENAFNAGGLCDDGTWPRVWISDARWLASQLGLKIRGGPYIGSEIVKAMESVPAKIIAAQLGKDKAMEGAKL